MMFEFAASGGALSQKRLHQKRSLFWNCLVITGGKFKHHKFLENVKFVETNNIDSILDINKLLSFHINSSLNNFALFTTFHSNSFQCAVCLVQTQYFFIQVRAVVCVKLFFKKWILRLPSLSPVASFPWVWWAPTKSSIFMMH